MQQQLRAENILAVGVDPAKDTLGIAVIRAPEEVLYNDSIPNLPEAFAELDGAVQHTAAGLGLTAVYALEDTGRFGKALCEFLLEKGRPVKEVNPILTHRQRAFYGQDKSDGIDAKCVGAVLMRRLDRLPDKSASDGLADAIKQLSSFRSAQVKQRTKLLNQLHYELEQTYMRAYNKFFSSLKHKTALEFFSLYPVPQRLKNTTAAELGQMLARTGRGRIKTTAAGILSAAAAVWDRPLGPLGETRAITTAMLCRQIAALNQDIALLEKQAAKLVAATGIPLTSITGISTVRAAVIIGQTGAAARFHSKHAYAKYNGTAPGLRSTGRSHKHVKNTSCNRTLRAELHQLALYMSTHDPMSIEYVKRHTQQGKTNGQAVNRLARRISDVIFAIMLSKKPYDPDIAAANMQRKKQRRAKNTGVNAKTIQINAPSSR